MSLKPLFFPKLTRQKYYPSYRYYRDYRDFIRKDSQYRCVYCDIHENEINRDLNMRDDKMTLDHFRPKSLFAHLENNPHNLVLACQDCNHHKSDDFPAYGRPDNCSIDGVDGYVDPFEVDRSDYFSVDANGVLKGRKHPADYMIRVLLLNGPYKRKIRKRRIQIQDSFEMLDDFFEKEIELINTNLSIAVDADKASCAEKLLSLQVMKTLLLSIQQMVELY